MPPEVFRLAALLTPLDAHSRRHPDPPRPMSLLPDSASFFEEVQAFFLACRGDGVALSDADARLIAQWEASGVPAEIVCQGIRAALSKHTFDGRVISRPRSIRSCRREVEQEIRRFQSLHPGGACEAEARTDSPPEPSPSSGAQDYFRQRSEALFQRLRELKTEGGLSGCQLAFLASLAAAQGVPSADAPDADSGASERFDDAVLIFRVRRQPFDQRIGIVRRAKAAAGPKSPMSAPRARAALLHRCLLRAIREADSERRS